MTEVIDPSLNGPTVLKSEVEGSALSRETIYEKLSTIGCCKLCSLRFSGEINIDSFRDQHKKDEDHKRRKIHTDTENGLKKVASNACVACLGMLQPPMCNKIIDKIVDAVSNEKYDNPTFNIAFTLPVSFYLRAHSLLVFLVNNYPQYTAKHLPIGVVTVGVKEAWKYVFADEVSERINKTFNNESELKILVDVQYEDDHSEISCLLQMYPNKFKDQKIKMKKLRHLQGPTQLFSRKSVESLLELGDRDHFAQFYPVPPPVPTHSALCNTVLFDQSCIYVAGRYNKYIRGLPQTAWFVQSERKLETSVHELIGEQVQALTGAQGSKLISSGREDVDVRMLGSGRPFALELLSPKHVQLSAQELSELEHMINTEAAGRVSVSHLTVVPKSTLDILKAGEEHKTKTYAAYCVASGVEPVKLEQLAGQAPLTLQQKTPVRVLHRRPIATRPRTVHWMLVSDIKTSPSNGSTYFKLKVNTQAGTYIKEFVHGDFGRTSPSVGDLLGGVTADCLALDVESIQLDWPPKSSSPR